MSVTDAGDASTTPGNLQKTGLKNLFADEDDEEDCDTTASNAGGIVDEERTAAAWQSITSSRTRAFGGEVNKTNSTVSTPAGNLENFAPRKSTLTASRTPMNDNPRSFAKVKAYVSRTASQRERTSFLTNGRIQSIQTSILTSIRIVKTDKSNWASRSIFQLLP